MFLAPYIYSWGSWSNQYIVGKFSHAKSKGIKQLTYGFIVSGDASIAELDAHSKELIDWVNDGGELIFSFGGASGIMLESVMTPSQEFNYIKSLIEKYKPRGFDWDIEGANIANTSLINNFITVAKRVMKEYPDLYISVTLPVISTGYSWHGDEFIKTMKNQDLLPHGFNLMTMNFTETVTSKTSNPNMGSLSILAAQNAAKTMSSIYGISEKEALQKISLCPMIGTDDTRSKFYPKDMTSIAKFVKDNKMRGITYWAINRDQKGTGNILLYSEENTTDLEFYNNAKNNLGPLTRIQNPTSTNVDDEVPQVPVKHKFKLADTLRPFSLKKVKK